MFEAHFGIHENPFHALSDPKDIFPSSELNEAVQHFFFAHGNRDAIMLLTGEVGTGKTTAVRAICEQLPPKTPLAVIEHGPITPDELIEELFRAFRLRRKPEDSNRERRQRFKAGLKRFAKAGRRPVLILDEAHLLANEVLEEVRLLTNLRHGGHPMVQVFLVGQEELNERLREHAMRPLRQRISVRYTMNPLSAAETKVYLVDRLKSAGSDIPERIFDHAAARAAHELSGGIPREINVLAGQAMLNAYIDHDGVVREKHVRTAIDHYGFEGASHRPAAGARSAATAHAEATSAVTEEEETETASDAASQTRARPEHKLQPGAPTTVPTRRAGAIQLFTAIVIVSAALILGAFLLWGRANGSVARGSAVTPEIGTTIEPVFEPAEPPPVAPEEPPTPTREGSERIGGPKPWAPASTNVEPRGEPAPGSSARSASRETEREATLAERYPSSLEVSSVEPMTVWLDETRLGVAPGTFTPVAPGRYRVRLESPDGRTMERDVVITLGSTTYVNASEP